MLKEGKFYQFRDQRFWACNGLIYIEDQQTGEFKSQPRKEFLNTADSFNKAISHINWADEREEMHRTVQDMIDCVKEAQNQGDPYEPGVIAQVGREARKTSWWTGEAAWKEGQTRQERPPPKPFSFEVNRPKWLKDEKGTLTLVPGHEPSEVFRNLKL